MTGKGGEYRAVALYRDHEGNLSSVTSPCLCAGQQALDGAYSEYWGVPGAEDKIVDIFELNIEVVIILNLTNERQDHREEFSLKNVSMVPFVKVECDPIGIVKN